MIVVACSKCGEELIPAPAKFDGEPTFVGYLPHECRPQSPSEIKGQQGEIADKIEKQAEIHANGIVCKFEEMWDFDDQRKWTRAKNDFIEGAEFGYKLGIASQLQEVGQDELWRLIQFVKNLEYMNGTKPQHEFTPQEIYQSFIKK